MQSEHQQTDFYLAKLLRLFGPDCGITAVKLDGFEQGSGMYAVPLWDYLVFPSGMRVKTQAAHWYDNWFDWWATWSLASNEAQLIADGGGGYWDQQDHREIDPLTKPSACLKPYYPGTR